MLELFIIYILLCGIIAFIGHYENKLVQNLYGLYQNSLSINIYHINTVL